MPAQENAKPIDVVALEEALRALGLLYGRKKDVLAELAAAAGDETSAIRAYLLHERPHLLSAYDIESLVEVVRAAMRRRAQHGPAIEQFTPKA